MNESLSKRQIDAQLLAELSRVLSEVRRRGFFGTATLTVSLQDGHIQHFRISTDRMIRPQAA